MLANEDRVRQAETSPQPVNPLKEGEGNLSWIPVLPARDCTVLALAPRQSKSSQSWTAESSGCKTSVFMKRKQEQRQRTAVSRERARDGFWICWELMKKTELYLHCHQEEARRGWMWSFAQQQGKDNTWTLHPFHRAKRLPEGSTHIPGLESQRRCLCLKHKSQQWKKASIASHPV